MTPYAGHEGQYLWAARRVPSVSLALFLTALLVFFWPPLTTLFQYDRAAVLGNEFWRVLTCQWTHWTFNHVVWDALMFLALGVLCERLCRSTFVACVAASAILIPIVGAVALPQMSYYRGLSGLDSALLVLLAMQLIRTKWSSDRLVATTAACGLVGFMLKTVYECVTRSTMFVRPESSFTPVPLAHIVGGVIGLVIALRGYSHEHKSHPTAVQPG